MLSNGSCEGAVLILHRQQTLFTMDTGPARITRYPI